MTVGEMVRKLSEYPEDWEVLIGFEPVERVECIEGRTSDGPGTLNIVQVD